MAQKKTHRLKGSSLIEVLIALAIGSACLAMASVIYINVQKGSLPFFRMKALELAEQCVRDTQTKYDLTDRSYQAEEFQVKKTVLASERFPDCQLVRVFVFDAGRKKICELETLIKIR